MPPKKRIVRRPQSGASTPARRRVVKRKRTGPTPTQEANLNHLVGTLASLRDQKRELEDQIKAAQDELLEVMRSTRQKGWKYEADDAVYEATYSQNSYTVVDDQQLKKLLGATMWNKVTTKSLDNKKLQAYLESGDIDPDTVSTCSSTEKSKPFVKVSTHVPYAMKEE